jgi:carbamoyl-phosphate synthase large subunit
MRLGSGAVVVCQPRAWHATFSDKLSALRAISDHALVAPFADGADHDAVARLVAEAGFPVVVKPRRSSGSRNVRVARTRGDLDAALTSTNQPLAQAYLKGDEFSVGVFRHEGVEAAIAFRRELRGGLGLSWTAESVDTREVTAYALEIARAADVNGSVNVQARMTPAGPRLLEINPRFSSLVAARAACGFHDAAWSLALSLGHPVEIDRGPYRHLRFQRFYHELVDLGDGFGALEAWLPRVIGVSQ